MLYSTVSQKFDELFSAKLNSCRVVHRMESPVLSLKKLILHNEFFNVMLCVICKTERIQCAFLWLEDVFENFFFAHSDIIMRGSNFFPVSWVYIELPLSGFVFI